MSNGQLGGLLGSGSHGARYVLCHFKGGRNEGFDLVAGLLLAGTGVMQAQAAHTMVSPAKSFDGSLSSFESEMMGLAKAMPAEKYSFVPTADFFKNGASTDFKTVKSFGDMVKHVAQANYSYAAGVSGMKPPVDVKAIGALKTKDGDRGSAGRPRFTYAHQADSDDHAGQRLCGHRGRGWSAFTSHRSRAVCRGAWLRPLRADGGVSDE